MWFDAAKVPTKFAVCFTSALLLTACAREGVKLPTNLRKDIDAANQAFVDGLKAGDADHIISSYSEDSVNCNPAGDCVRGATAAALQYKEVITKLGRATSGFVRSETLHVDHDLAYESGYAEEHFLNGAVRSGRFSTVWKLQSDGHWKIFRNVSLASSP
jgi:ketosteroid isomerase-like protein